MLCITFCSPHPLIKVPDTSGLCSSEELRGGKKYQLHYPNCRAERTAGQLSFTGISLRGTFQLEGVWCTYLP